jgi:hypothetical protein
MISPAQTKGYPHHFTQGIARALFACACLTIIGCTAPATVTKTPTPQAQVDPDSKKIDQIINWLESWSLEARSLSSEGSMTVSNQETQQSGNFTLKTKRMQVTQSKPPVSMRVDSVSLEARGPFGITGVRFLASPSHYALWNILMGETVEGVTNAQALEGLTQLKGITLQSMNDVIFGLPPSPDDIDPQDSTILFSRTPTSHILVIYRFKDNYTEALSLDGVITEDQPIALTQMRLTKYERWNGQMMNYANPASKPQASIKYSGHTTNANIPFANTLEVTTGQNKLLLEYEEVQMNPPSLTVYINVPGRKR